MKKRIAIILVVVMGTMSLGNAQDIFKKELFSIDMVMKYRSEIGLSESAEAAIKSVYNEKITGFNALKWDLDATMNDLDKILNPSRIDALAAKEKMQEVLELEEDLKMIRLEMLVAIKNELSEEQQTMLKGLRTAGDLKGQAFIAPINEDPRVVLKVEGKKANESPMYIIIDGDASKKVSEVSDIDPDEIESIEVLKGASAIEKYGEEAKNGVVIIKLK